MKTAPDTPHLVLSKDRLGRGQLTTSHGLVALSGEALDQPSAQASQDLRPVVRPH
jgi:hypothetical protein